ncbi:MAG TPA: phosphoribosylglycinamide formyltransferase, partial [Devosia sp.]|nr:phosphoribosylglycinamide formyltransferase [Devosia sp.]
HKNFSSREAFDTVIEQALADWYVDYVCLAGFMRIFSTSFAQKWTGRMLNIHPSLLPKFKGLHPHQQALDAGEKVHGCTVHWVIPELDDGPTILQTEVPILPGDTAETLAARTLIAEHSIYPEALRMLASGGVSAP